MLELGLVIPPEFKFEFAADKLTHYGSRKVLHRRGLKGSVSPEILASQIKATYGVPMFNRLKTYLPRVFNEPHRSLVAEFGIIHAKKFKNVAWNALFDADFSQMETLAPWLDAILHLELWIQATIEEFPSTRLL